MPFAPALATASPEKVIGTTQMSGLGYECRACAAAPASAVWPTANKAIFVPVVVSRPMLIVQMAVLNGTVAAGNIDVGIYDESWNRLVSKGATAQSGTSVFQLFDITDTYLTPGRYYLGVAKDDGVGTVFQVAPGAPKASMFGVGTAASSYVLPNPAVPLIDVTNDVIPVVYASVEAVI